jgi:hypothetical protein
MTDSDWSSLFNSIS